MPEPACHGKVGHRPPSQHFPGELMLKVRLLGSHASPHHPKVILTLPYERENKGRCAPWDLRPHQGPGA